MELTGITRRIDQLGRIVIPKEIRASLRIKNGDELEIYTKENDIILKKNSSLNKLTDIGNIIVSSLNYYLKFNVFLTDKDKYISISGSLKNKYLNKEISKEIQSIIEKRTPILFSQKALKLTETNQEQGNFIINPIIVNGDAFGALIIYSEKEVIDNTIPNLLTMVLSKYLE